LKKKCNLKKSHVFLPGQPDNISEEVYLKHNLCFLYLNEKQLVPHWKLYIITIKIAIWGFKAMINDLIKHLEGKKILPNNNFTFYIF